MGEETFSQLAKPLQRFHRLRGVHILLGNVETDAPANVLARLLALCLGSPRGASSGPLRFELDAQPDVETWIRGFPGKTMRSQLRLKGGLIEEHLGAARLTFRLSASAGGGLRMELLRMRFLGVPCPKFCRPRIVAEESGEDSGEVGRLHFRVSASVPWLGPVVGYRGHLALSPA